MKLALVNFLIHYRHINTFNTTKHLNHTTKVKAQAWKLNITRLRELIWIPDPYYPKIKTPDIWFVQYKRGYPLLFSIICLIKCYFNFLFFLVLLNYRIIVSRLSNLRKGNLLTFGFCCPYTAKSNASMR